MAVPLKPQLIVTDLSGEHNRDLKQSSSRLLKGNSWKKQRVVVILPAADDIPAKIALALWSLAFPPNNGVVRVLALGMEVGDAYSTAIENVIGHPELSQWEYILTVEHDNAPPADGVIRLIERLESRPDLSCVSGLYFTKGPAGCAQIWGDPNDMPMNFRPQVPDVNGGLVECNGVGMGFALWRMGMFKDKQLPRPLFRTRKNVGGEGIFTQDLAFWMEARKYGYKCAVACDVKVGHYQRELDMMW
jgi:hypothetical protein